MSNVSRETSEALDHYEAMVRKWTPKINLVSKSTLNDFKTRHIADSIQVFRAAPLAWESWYDLGSGGGLPGVIVAILAKDEQRPTQVTLIEADQRKATFLRAVIRELSLNASVVVERIEKVNLPPADVVSARALASLPDLLAMANDLMKDDGLAVFSKGKSWQQEVESACQEWSFTHEVVQSSTAVDAVILKIKEVSRV